MAGLLHTDVYDNGLNAIKNNANALHILKQDPGVVTYANIATHTLGNKATPTIGSPVAHTTGRKVVVSEITDGDVTAGAAGGVSATHFALVDTVNSKTLVVQELATPQTVTEGNVFTLTAMDVAIPAPVA